MEFDETIVIPSSAGINLPFDILTPDLEINSELIFEINDTRKDLVELPSKELLLRKLHKVIDLERKRLATKQVK